MNPQISWLSMYFEEQDSEISREETCFTAVLPLETGPQSLLRECRESGNTLDICAGLCYIMEPVQMAANCVIESNDRVIGERKNVEVVDCRKATDRWRSVQ